MCGRYTIRHPKRVVGAFLKRELAGLPTPKFNIGPGGQEVVIRPAPDQPTGREAALLWWGFIPAWKEANPKAVINVRSETAAEKPMFRAAFNRRRCLVPADGFYEWRRTGREKQPIFFSLRDDEPFAFAGLWEEWKSDQTIRETFCLLTTAPNQLMASVHNRMPVILDQESASRWLEAGPDEDDVTSLLRPFPVERMTAREVGIYVNKTGNEGPKCLEPPEQREEQMGLF